MRPLVGFHRILDYPRDPVHRGPGKNFYCPCGSHRSVRSCHRSAGGYWLAQAPVPLLADARTGYTHPRCYGNASQDCSSRISREHWLSASILREILGSDTGIVISGLPWLRGETKSLPVSRLFSFILCERHNNHSSSLDTVAGQFFRATKTDQLSLAEPDHPDRAKDAFALCQGSELERWLLKLFWGALEAKSLGRDGDAISDLKTGLDKARLADILWRGSNWPNGWGMYMQAHEIDPHGTPNSVAIEAHTGPGGKLWGGSVTLGALQLRLGLGVASEPPENFIYRPGGIVITAKGAMVEKVIALAWPEPGHRWATYERQGAAIE